jgi:hypothetical protein
MGAFCGLRLGGSQFEMERNYLGQICHVEQSKDFARFIDKLDDASSGVMLISFEYLNNGGRRRRA